MSLYELSCNSKATQGYLVLEIVHDGSENEHELLGVHKVPEEGISVEMLMDRILDYIHLYYTPEEIRAFKYKLIEQIVVKD